jgi:sulfate transport system substrate-binding protein
MNEQIAGLLQRRRGSCWLGWLLVIVALIVAGLYGLRAVLVNANAPLQLVVYGFSTQEEAFTQGVFPAFAEVWARQSDRDLSLEGVFGPSGTLAGQINLGAPADIALFSRPEHVDWLRLGRRVRGNTQPVVVGCTPMIIVTRSGNPAGISEFADLAQPGLELLHADPRSSGAGEWAVLAEYGSALSETGDPVQAKAQLKAIWDNVKLLAPSARAALTLFELGAGDALVTYEQDARLAQLRDVDVEIVVPPTTIVAQHVAVIVDDNVTAAERPVAQTFIDYLSSDAGRAVLDRYYLRPASCQSDQFPKLERPFTAEELAGWQAADPSQEGGVNVIEEIWQVEIAPRLELQSDSGLWSEGD